MIIFNKKSRFLLCMVTLLSLLMSGIIPTFAVDNEITSPTVAETSSTAPEGGQDSPDTTTSESEETTPPADAVDNETGSTTAPEGGQESPDTTTSESEETTPPANAVDNETGSTTAPEGGQESPDTTTNENEETTPPADTVDNETGSTTPPEGDQELPETVIVPDNTATTPPADTAAPTWTDTTLTASNITQTGMTLSWTTAVYDMNVVSYKVYLDGAELTSVSDTSYEVSGLSAAAEYTFKVEAGDEAGNWSTDGPGISVTTLAADEQITEPKAMMLAASIPAADTAAPTWTEATLTASNITQTGMTLTWSTAVDDTGVVGYKVYLNGAELTSLSKTSYEVTGLTAATEYTFKVEAGDEAGNWSTDGPVTPATTLAAEPTVIPLGVATPVVTTSPMVFEGGIVVDMAKSAAPVEGTTLTVTEVEQDPIAGLKIGKVVKLAYTNGYRGQVQLTIPLNAGIDPAKASIYWGSPTTANYYRTQLYGYSRSGIVGDMGLEVIDGINGGKALRAYVGNFPQGLGIGVFGLFEDTQATPYNLELNSITSSEAKFQISAPKVDGVTTVDPSGILSCDVYRDGVFLLNYLKPESGSQGHFDSYFYYNDATVQQGTTYRYSIKTYDWFGNVSGFSPEVSVSILTDAETVAAIKAMELVTFAEGDSADSVTQDLGGKSQPYSNATVTYESSNNDVFNANTFKVTKPAEADSVDVKLTETIKCGIVTDTKEYNLTVRWTETSSVSTFAEFTSALNRPLVKTIVLKSALSGTGTFDCYDKTIMPNFSGTYMLSPATPSLNLGNLTVNGNNASTTSRVVNIGNSLNLNFDNITFQGTDGFGYLIYTSERNATQQYEIVANNCRFSPVTNYAFFATTTASYKGKPGYGKKMILTGNTFASGANIKIEAGIATLTNNIINSKIHAMIGSTLNDVVITDEATAKQAVDALLASNQITAPIDGSYGLIIYNKDGTELYKAHKIDQPKPTFVGASTDSNGSKVMLEFNMAMADPSSQKDQFVVSVNGTANLVTAAALNTDDSKKIDLTLTASVVNGDVVKISYTPGTVGSAGDGLLESFIEIDVVNNVPLPIVDTPTASPPVGEVDKNTTVTLATATASASIYYTLDGTPPTKSSSLYQNPIVIDEAKTINAIAVKEGMQDSSVLTASYTVKADTRVIAYLCEINSDNTSTAGTLISSSSAVPVDPIIKLKFSSNVVSNSAQNISCVSLLDSSGQAVQDVDVFTLGTGDAGNPEKANIFIQPKSLLALSTTYKIVISTDVTFKNGSKLGEPASEIVFSTVDKLPDITFAKATLSGSNLTLAGLSSGANLEYRIVTGSEEGSWIALTYTGTTATINSNTLSLVSGVSQVEVRAVGGSGAVANQPVLIAVDGSKVEMKNDVSLCFEDNVTVTPESLNTGETNQTGILRTTLPSEMKYKIFPVGFAYEIYLQGSGDAKKATLSFPVDPALNINQMSVYTLDKSYDTTADKSNPIAWRLEYLEPDRSQADKHIISVPATDVPEMGGSFVYQVFYDNWLPGPVAFTAPAIVDIENHKITFPQIQATDTDKLSKIEVYRDGNMIGLIDMGNFGGTYSYTDTDPSLQVGYTYAYNLKAYDRMGNWTWQTNAGVSPGSPMSPSGDTKVLFEDDASVVEKVKQELLNGALPITFAPGDSFDHVVTDFELPNPHDSWPYVWITWSSSDPEVIRTLPGYTAIVVKPADGQDKEVTLTATIERQGNTATPVTATASWKIKVSWEPWAGGVMPIRTQDSHNGVRDTMYEFWTALNKDNIQKIIMLESFAYDFPDNTLDCKGKTLVFQKCILNSVNYGDGVNVIIKNGTIDATGTPFEAVALAQQSSGFIFDNVEFKGGEALDSYIQFKGGSLVLTNCRFGNTKVAPVSIQPSTITNYNEEPSGIRIENCTFDGAGKPGYAVRYEKDGTLTAVNNTITGFQGNTSSGNPSAGLLIPSGRTATLVGNKISNCDNDILVQTRSSSNSNVNGVQIANKDAAEQAGMALLESNELTPGTGPVVVINNVDSLFHPVLWYQADKDEVTGSIVAPIWTNGSLTASEIDETELTLSWSGASDTVAVTGYKVYQGANLIATIPSTDTSYHVTNLLPGTKYQFRVEAGNAQGKWSLDGPTVDAITSANTAPVWPEGSQVSVTEVGPNSVILSWTTATDEQGIRLYDVYANGQGTQHWTKASNPSSAVVYISAVNLQPDTEYTFQIYAEDTLKVKSPGPSVKVKTAVGAPTNWTLGKNWLAATNIQSNSLTLNWSSANMIEPPADAEYKIFCNDQELATFSHGAIKYDVTGLKESTSYKFKLEVSEDGKWSTDGPAIEVKTPAQGTQNGQVGSPVDLYLNGSDKWIDSISDVQISGNYDNAGQSIFSKCTVANGHIQIGADAFSEAKAYDLLIRSTGYPDVYVTQTMLPGTPEQTYSYEIGTPVIKAGDQTVTYLENGKTYTITVPVSSIAGSESIETYSAIVLRGGKGARADRGGTILYDDAIDPAQRTTEVKLESNELKYTFTVPVGMSGKVYGSVIIWDGDKTNPVAATVSFTLDIQ